MRMIRSFRLLSWVICLASLVQVGRAQPIKVGAALRVITPNPLLPVSGGLGTPKPATQKKGDLYARAMVMEQGGTRVAIVSVDNIGWPAILGDKSRALIKGILPENVLIGCTHTHSGPDAYAFPNEKGEHGADLNYLDWCVRQIAEAVNEAVRNLEPAHLKIAHGETKGKIAYNYYAPQLYDPRCGVIQAVAAEGPKRGRPIVTLVNYAIHPEVLGNGQGILSPDLCGPLYDRIEAQGGGMALFMNGAQGGMITADNRLEGGGEANTWEECIRIGQLLADEALRLVADAPALPTPQLYVASKEIEFPIESPMMRYILQHSALKYPGPTYDRIRTRLNLLNIGPAQVLTIPGEALPNIGFYLKRKMPTGQPFLFGLTNDAFGYILTKEDFGSFKRYEYVSRTSLGELTGEIYLNEVLRWLGEAPKPEATTKR